MEKRDVVEIYKSIDEETAAKVREVKEEASVKIHEIADKHLEVVEKFVKDLSDTEYAVLMKSADLDLTDKMIITSAYTKCNEEA